MRLLEQVGEGKRDEQENKNLEVKSRQVVYAFSKVACSIAASTNKYHSC